MPESAPTPTPEFVTADKLPGAMLAAAPAGETALAPTFGRLAVEASEGEVNEAQVEVLKRTLCAGKLSDNQLLLFLTRCARLGVDPFTQAYCFPQGDGGIAMGLRIDGMRALAMKTGQLESRVVESVFAEADGERVKKGDLVGARATIKRRGVEGPISEEAWLAEYNKADTPGGIIWRQMPETMIRKVAETKALRAAFPDALGGVYEPAEME